MVRGRISWRKLIDAALVLDLTHPENQRFPDLNSASPDACTLSVRALFIEEAGKQLLL
jgi:hypothetical protein